MSSVINQLFYLLQLVEPIDMNTLYNDIGQKINAYFPATPAIMNGLNYIQTGTTNVITTQKGSVRWKDQSNVLSVLPQFTWTILDPVTNLTITCPASVPQKYIVAKVTKVAVNTTFISVTGEILDTAYTLAEIAAFANPDEYAPLWTITNNTGVYTIGTDANCAVNYSGLYGLLAADNTWLGNNSFVQNLSKLNQSAGSIGNVALYNDSLNIILGTLSSTNGLVFAPGEQRPLLQFNNSPLATLADVDAANKLYVSRQASGTIAGSGKGNISAFIFIKIWSQVNSNNTLSNMLVLFQPSASSAVSVDTVVYTISSLLTSMDFTFALPPNSNPVSSVPITSTGGALADIVTVGLTSTSLQIGPTEPSISWSFEGSANNYWNIPVLGRFTA